MIEPGNVFVISAPSGTGKTTLVNTLVDHIPRITVSVSHTTREQRPAETNGINYFFVSEPEFERMVRLHEFLEHAIVFHHSYGTSHRWVEETLKQGIDVILEIDWQGCQQIRRLFPHAVSIFILPPSITALAQRLKQRNQDSLTVIEQRLADFQETTKHMSEYDYIVINDDFQSAVSDLTHIVLASRLVRHRQLNKVVRIIKHDVE